MDNNGLEQVTLRLSQQQRGQLASLAREWGCSHAHLLREAVGIGLAVLQDRGPLGTKGPMTYKEFVDAILAVMPQYRTRPWSSQHEMLERANVVTRTSAAGRNRWLHNMVEEGLIAWDDPTKRRKKIPIPVQ